MNIGHKIRTIRIAKKIEPIEMALKLNISETTYRRYERNESEPTITIFHKIAKIFGIETSYFLEEDIDFVLLDLKGTAQRTILEYEKHIDTLKQKVNELKRIERRC